jgi:glycosyltransferase involved in cell wall biosynthesis
MWALTGGCHYAGECERYKDSCGACPELGSEKEKDLSRKFWRRKKEAYNGLNLTIVTPSRWLAECARQSSLLRDFPVKVIPNGLDLELFGPVDRRAARDKLGLPVDKKLILFGAVSSTSDRRKGFHLLQPALRHLSANRTSKDVELLVFGAAEPENPPDFGLPARYLGTLSDEEELALLYGAADVCAVPSLQDNLPNIVAEAMACGTPCVAFDIGGMPDMIEHKRNGYLARPFDAEDLARGMAWVLQQENLNPRQTAEEMLELTLASKRYKNLYEDLITTKSTKDTKSV